jgi:hypothetical protein
MVVVLVQVELVTLVEVVVAPTQPPAWQASQQLERLPAQALPLCGALHLAAPFLIEHLVTPLAFVRQQVT